MYQLINAQQQRNNDGLQHRQIYELAVHAEKNQVYSTVTAALLLMCCNVSAGGAAFTSWPRFLPEIKRSLRQVTAGLTGNIVVTLHLTHSDLHLASRASAAGLIGEQGTPGVICVAAASRLRPPQVPQLHPLRPGFAFSYLPSRIKTQLKITINRKCMNSSWSPDCINTKHTELFGPSST